MDYDTWRLNGSRHRCECGREWWDADGGPCHAHCRECGELYDADDLENDLCASCRIALVHTADIELCRECGALWESEHNRCHGNCDEYERVDE